MGITHLESIGDNLLVSLSFDCTVRVTDIRTGVKRFSNLNINRSRYVGISFNSEHQELYLADEAGNFEIWNMLTETLQASHHIASHGQSVVGLSYYNIPYPPPLESFPPLDFVIIQKGQYIESHKFERDLPHKELEGHDGPVVAVCYVELAGALHTHDSDDEIEGSIPGTPGTPNPPGTPVSVQSRAITDASSKQSESNSESHIIFTASVDNTWRNWDPKELRCRLAMTELTSEIRSMCFAPRNRVLCTGNDDGSIRIWNPDGGSPQTCEGHDNTVSALDIGILNRQEYLFSGSFDGSVAMWDINRRTSKSSLVVNHMSLGDYEVQSIKYCEHLQLVLAGTNDGVIYLYDPLRSSLVREFRGHVDTVTCLDLDGNFLVSGAEDRTVKVWNLLNGQLLKEHKKHRRSVEDLFVVEASGVVVSCATDGCIICWDYTNSPGPEEEGEQVIVHTQEQREEFISISYKHTVPKMVVAGTESAKVVLFPLPPEVTDPRSSTDAGEYLSEEDDDVLTKLSSKSN